MPCTGDSGDQLLAARPARGALACWHHAVHVSRASGAVGRADASLMDCREVFKFVLLVPLVPIRIAVIILAAAVMALGNTLATLGW